MIFLIVCLLLYTTPYIHSFDNNKKLIITHIIIACLSHLQTQRDSIYIIFNKNKSIFKIFMGDVHSLILVRINKIMMIKVNSIYVPNPSYTNRIIKIRL